MTERQKNKNHPFHRILKAALGLFLLLLVLQNIPYERLDASDTEDESGGFELSLNWNTTDTYVSTDKLVYDYDSQIDETKVIRLNVRYANKDMQGVSYKPGEVVITVNGIGGASVGAGYRGSTLEAFSVGADKASSTKKSYAWSYTYSRSSDTYTFTNNNELLSTEHFAGSFEILWQMPSRSSIDAYDTEIQAALRAKGGVKVESNTASYRQERYRDTFKLDLEGTSLGESDGYDFSISNRKDYYWVRYTATSMQTTKSWGLSDSYFKVTIPADGELQYAARKTSLNGTGTPVSWNTESSSGNMTTYTVAALAHGGTAYLEYIVAYPVNTYKNTSDEIRSEVEIWGTYYEENTEEQLDTAEKEVPVWTYEFPTYRGYIVGGSKSAQGIGAGTAFARENNVYSQGYIDSLHMENEKGEYTFSLYGIVNHYAMLYDCYNLEITDDDLQVQLLGGGTDDNRPLEDDEYSFTSITIPARSSVRNANGDAIQAGYAVEVQVKSAGGSYEKLPGNYTFENSQQRITLADGISGIRLIVRGMKESIRVTFPVTVKFHADTDDIQLDGGNLVNTMRIGLEGYNESGAVGGRGRLENMENLDAAELFNTTGQGSDENVPEQSVENGTENGKETEAETEIETETQTETGGGTTDELSQPESGMEETTAGTSVKERIFTQEPAENESERETSAVSPASLVIGEDGIHRYDYIETATVENPYLFFEKEEDKMIFGDTLKILERPNFYYNRTALDRFRDDGKDGFSSTITLSSSFDYLEEEILESFSMYTILPAGMELGSGIIDEESLYDALSVSVSNGMGISISALQRALTIEMMEDYRGSGCTYIAFSFQFSRAVMEPSGSMSLSFPVYVAKRDFAARNSSYTARGITMTEDSHLIIRPSQGPGTDDGSYVYGSEALWSDINGNSDTGEILSYYTASQTPSVYAYASEVAATKYVGTSSTGYKYVQPEKDGSGVYKEEEIPSTAVAETYSYKLQVSTGSDSTREASGIVVMDVLETADLMEWQGSLVLVDASDAEAVLTAYNGRDIKAVIYYSEEDYSSEIAQADKNYKPNLSAAGWTTDKSTLGEVRSIAVDFGDAAISGSEYLVIEVTMEAPAGIMAGQENLSGKLTENGFGVFYEETDTVSGTVEEIWLPSNEVPVTLSAYREDIYVVKSDKEDGTLLEGAAFTLYRQKGNVPDTNGDEVVQTGLTTNARGRIVIRNLEEGSYYLVETKAPMGYQQPDDMDPGSYYVFEIDGQNPTAGLHYVKIENERKEGRVILEKRNNLNDATLVAGAKFTLYDADGTEIETGLETDAEGRIHVDGLEWGSFYFVETESPAGYEEPDGTEYWFEVNAGNDAGSSLLVEVTNNQEEFAKVKLVKYEALEDGTQTTDPMADVAFTLYRKDDRHADDPQVGTYITDGNGEILVEDLGFGSYYFKENMRITGYEENDDEIEFSLTADKINQTIELTVHNQRKYGEIFVYKMDDDSNLVDGALYGLYKKEDDSLIDQQRTENGGELWFRDVVWGEYYIKEIEAPEGYELNNTPYDIVVNARRVESTITQRVYDARLKGSVRLLKVDDSGNVITSDKAEFNLYRNDGTLYRQGLETNGAGEIYVDELEWGSYYFQEVKAPAGYSLSDEKIRFSINAKNVHLVQELEAENRMGEMSLILRKRIPVDSLVFSHGNPTFIFKVEGQDVNGKEYIWYRTITFDAGSVTAENIKEDPSDNNREYVELSTTFSKIPEGEYTATEEEVIRYQFKEIINESSKAEVNMDGTVTFDLIGADQEQDGIDEATFVNVKMDQGETSATVQAQNLVKTTRKLTGLTVDYREVSISPMEEILIQIIFTSQHILITEI